MSNRRGNDMNESGAFASDTTAKIDPTKDLTDENKAEWIKRRVREDKKHRQGLKISDEWFEVIDGKKLIKKVQKNNGGVYSLYVCNLKDKKNKGVLETLVKGSDGKYRRKGGTK